MSRLFEIHSAQGTQRLADADLPLLIGVDDSAHVRLTEGPAVAAYVGESRSHLFLQPAAGIEGLLILHNDEPLNGSVWLKSGDVTRIGETLIMWQVSGQRVEVKLASVASALLKPPLTPPVSHQDHAQKPTVEPLADAVPTETRQGHGFRRKIIATLFVLLVVAAVFVLVAKPLVVTLTPVPDRLSVSGFLPVVKLGDRFLGFPGRYQVRAEKTGYRPFEAEVDITSQGNRYIFMFEKLPGQIDVTSEPPGVSLLLDGTMIGTTPIKDVDVPLGTHTLRFEHARYLPHEQTITVHESGERQMVEVTLQPAWAKVLLQTVPPGANLLVDGVDQGPTPLELELLAGEHQLQFNQQGFAPLVTTMVVAAGENQSPPAYQLQTAPATVTITSEPPGATVAVGGVFRGQTPLTTRLPSNQQHDIKVSAAGFSSAKRLVSFRPEEQQTLEFKLVPEYGTVFIAAIPPQAMLLIDGKPQATATGRFRLPAREHQLELRAEGYQPASRVITPQPGYSQRVELTLSPLQSTGPSSVTLAPAAKVQTGVGQDLVLIKPGPYVMGASRQEPGRRANEAEQQVTLQRHFYIAAREVTNREFRRYKDQHVSGMAGNRSLDIDSHPVVNVSWEDAVRFLNWLSRQDGLPPFYREVNGKFMVDAQPGTGYRLPTEAEWEYVARQAGRKESDRYPWQGSYPPQKKVGNFADESARQFLPVVINGYQDGFPATAPAGSFPADSSGLHDLGGNVAEWCHDYYAAQVVKTGKTPVDPMGSTSGTHHVVRGSSWRDASITELRFSYRRYSRAAADDIGFRVARYVE